MQVLHSTGCSVCKRALERRDNASFRSGTKAAQPGFVKPWTVVGPLAILQACAHGPDVAARAAAPAHDHHEPEQTDETDSTDLSAGYVIVADGVRSHRRGDWEPPDTLLIAWERDWADSLLTIIAAAQPVAKVMVVVRDRDLSKPDFRAWWATHRTSLLRADYDTPWIRDYGPSQRSVSGGLEWDDFGYAEERPADDRVPKAVAEQLRAPVTSRRAWLDGGAVVSNGRGLCAMTDASLDETFALTETAGNRAISESDLLEEMGCRSVAVVPALPGEQTGHADVAMQFLSPTVVAVASASAARNPEVSAALDEAAATVLAAGDVEGLKLTVVRVPMHVREDVFYSYVNATRLVDRMLVPTYQRVPRSVERRALDALGEALQGVAVVPVPADEMVERGGAVHCITLGLGTPEVG